MLPSTSPVAVGAGQTLSTGAEYPVLSSADLQLKIFVYLIQQQIDKTVFCSELYKFLIKKFPKNLIFLKL